MFGARPPSPRRGKLSVSPVRALLVYPESRRGGPALKQEAESHCLPRIEYDALAIQDDWYPIGNDDLVRGSRTRTDRFLFGFQRQAGLHQREPGSYRPADKSLDRWGHRSRDSAAHNPNLIYIIASRNFGCRSGQSRKCRGDDS